MKILAIMLLMATSAGAQAYKGICSGTQSDPKDLSAIPDTPAIKCDSMVVSQIGGHTAVAFSNGLAFTGVLSEVHSADPSIASVLRIDGVSWDEESPLQQVQGDTEKDRGCYFHYAGDHLTEVECELIVANAEHRRRRATVTFIVK